MALDKLVDSTQLDGNLTSVANAIRAKSGGNGQLAFPAGFVSEIGNIPTGGGGITPTGTKEITITENGTTTEDVTNYASAQITVNVPSSGGGGVDRGEFTPETNTLVATFNVSKQITGFVIFASENPYTKGANTRVCGCLIYDQDPTSVKVGVGSNATGTSGGVGFGSGNFSVSQNGNVVTVTNANNAYAGYYVAGLTYRWIAW